MNLSSQGYAIPAPIDSQDYLINLAHVDWGSIESLMQGGRLRTETERLRNALEQKLNNMYQLNKSRREFLERLQQLIDEYNLGAHTTEEFFKNLVKFAKELTEEEQRTVREGLSEEELAIFDLLTKPNQT